MIYPILVVIEKGETSYGAYAPDLPGCIAVGDNRKETEQLMYEALQEHIEWMLEDGDDVPEQPSTAVYIVVPGNNGSGTKQFLAIIQNKDGRYYAEVPKLDGCAAEGATSGEAEQRIYEAIQAEVEVMQQRHEKLPDNMLAAMYMAIPVRMKEAAAALSQAPQGYIFPQLIPPHCQRQSKAEPAVLPTLKGYVAAAELAERL